MTAIGRLSQRLVLERPVAVGDGAGGRVETFAALGEVWAEIVPAGAGEREIAGRLDGVASHRIAIRYRGDVRGGMRFVTADGRVFRILATFDPDGRRRRLVCVAEEEGR